MICTASSEPNNGKKTKQQIEFKFLDFLPSLVTFCFVFLARNSHISGPARTTASQITSGFVHARPTIVARFAGWSLCERSLACVFIAISAASRAQLRPRRAAIQLGTSTRPEE
jgi:hypothetical protein